MGKVRELLEQWDGDVLRCPASTRALRDALEADEAEQARGSEVTEQVREAMETARSCFGLPLSALVEWFDAKFPRPMPQWEKDARLLFDASIAIMARDRVEQLSSNERDLVQRLRERAGDLMARPQGPLTLRESDVSRRQVSSGQSVSD